MKLRLEKHVEACGALGTCGALRACEASAACGALAARGAPGRKIIGR